MTSSSSRTARTADVIQGWFVGYRTLGRDQVTTWRSHAGKCAIDFSCTHPRTAEIAAARLYSSHEDVAAVLRLGLLETRVLSWPMACPCESQDESLTLMRELEDRGISALIPVGRQDDPALWVVYSAADRTGFIVLPSVADLPPWMVNAPFSLLLHLAFALRGQRLLHAASLGLNGRGALIVGPGGAGKSATTIAGLVAGLSTVGDDYLVFDFDPPPTARPVYRTLKQSPAGLSRMPAVWEQTVDLPLNWHGKLEFDADLARPGSIASELVIEAILIPRQENRRRTDVQRAPPTAAFSAVAPSTLSQLPGEGLRGFAQITRLTRTLPAFWLRLSNDADEIGACLHDFFARVPG